jgi:hypothetical protein
MDRISQRKPKLHFDVAANPSHVTFDDGKEQRRNIRWLHYEEACWDYAEPDTIRMEIGDCVVVIWGQNLGPLFQAIEEETLMRIRAQPELDQESEREMDTFATEIRFLRAAKNGGKRNGQTELNLGLE